MKEFLLLVYFCFIHLLLAGQNIKTISIDLGNASPLNLSEISEKVTPIVLEESPGGVQNILLTNEYLFMASINTIVQYDLSGKFIRRINCEGYVTDNITCDTVKKELYVPVRDKIKCYDYNGKIKKEYSLKTKSAYCFFYKGVLWVQSCIFQPDKTTDYFINKVNLLTGEVTTLPFMKKDEPFQFNDGSFIQVSALCRLTLYNGDVFASFDFDNTIYKIQNDKVIPFVKWEISPLEKNKKSPLGANGFIGDYLFINYRRDDQFYIYLENMKTGKKYNASKVIDDVFNSSGNCKIKSLEQKGCFYFFKEKSEINGNNIGNIPLKNGPVVFIIKTK